LVEIIKSQADVFGRPEAQVPTDEAFAKIPKADLDALLKYKTKLTVVLTCHVVPAAVMAKDVKAGMVKTV